MTNQTDALQTVLTDADELLRARFRELGLPDTAFVLVAVSPDDDIIVRGNFDPEELKMLVKDLGEVAEEASVGPTDEDPIH